MHNPRFWETGWVQCVVPREARRTVGTLDGGRALCYHTLAGALSPALAKASGWVEPRGSLFSCVSIMLSGTEVKNRKPLS
jgi:hypothetical protein